MLYTNNYFCKVEVKTSLWFFPVVVSLISDQHKI